MTLRLPRFARPRPDEELGRAAPGRRGVRLYLLKPSKYAEDGSVLAFRWGVIPCHTLIVLVGIAEAAAAARSDLDLQIVVWDELVDGVVTPAVVASIAERAQTDGVDLLVGLVAVQTNQYPRARDLALQLRARGVAVAMGGFHVSSHEPSRAFLARAGVVAVVGEAESSFDELLADFLDGRLAPEYRVRAGIRARTGAADITVPPIEAATLPAVSPRYLRSFLNPSFSTIDTSRGCPFVCSFCSVKNVMGRTMRSREPSAVVAWAREAHDRHGVRTLLVVDDDFYRSPRWREVLRGLAELRHGGRALALLMQVDVQSALAKANGERVAANEFVELAAAAGCFQVFVGLESFDPDNLAHVAKHQNRGRREAADVRAAVKAGYARAIAAWHRAGVAVHCGYIIGLPHDRPGCGRRAARDLVEVGIDLASFFAYTPFPGTEDHAAALGAERIFDHDFDHYDSTHFVMRHPTLSPAALAREYADAYRAFYDWRRLAWCLGTGHRVAGLSAAARAGMVSHHLYYTYATRRGWHPMLGGVWRLRSPVRREAVTDEEAATRYGLRPHVLGKSPGATRLGAEAPRPSNQMDEE